MSTNNATSLLPTTLPSLPKYTLTLRPSLIPGVSDVALQLLVIVIAYWATSLVFHIIDTYDIFPEYRLHTPAEIVKRNRVTRYEVVRDVVLQQFIQTCFGFAIAYFDPPEMIGKEGYDVAIWALRLRKLQHYVPNLLMLLGVQRQSSLSWSLQHSSSYPNLAGIVAGGMYSTVEFKSWETNVAKLIYWVVVPALQFGIAVVWVDTWQYFLHRWMHMNKFLYNWLHSRHHRLYVPYAFGALYNHPLEGFLLDILGTGVATIVTGMSVRQAMCFYAFSTVKTVDDHCGYAFPWDPLQRVSSNNAAYHDIHHQTWGIKTNFSQPFFTFWDRFLGTTWKGGDVSSRYERDRIAAQKKVDADPSTVQASVAASPRVDVNKAKVQAQESQKQVLDSDPNGEQVLREEAREEKEVKQSIRRSGRRKSGFDPKSLSERVAGSLHGRSSAILHADGVH